MARATEQWRIRVEHNDGVVRWYSEMSNGKGRRWVMQPIGCRAFDTAQDAAAIADSIQQEPDVKVVVIETFTQTVASPVVTGSIELILGDPADSEGGKLYISGRVTDVQDALSVVDPEGTSWRELWEDHGTDISDSTHVSAELSDGAEDYEAIHAELTDAGFLVT